MSLLIWLGIALHPARPWDFQPVGDDGELPAEPPSWPSVNILVPARNEREALPHTLPALLQQDYPGPFSVTVIDDRSNDGTAEVARKLAQDVGQVERLLVLPGAPLPAGWVGKVWALEQGAAACGVPSSRCAVLSPQSSEHIPQYLLLTDADIHHTSGSLRRLVAESEHKSLALNSRMARLRCLSAAEQLLIPPFVFFFNLLYPMRHVNNPRSSVAAAAGGCVLLSTAALQQAGGFACIKDRIIDDVSLAMQIKRLGRPVRLALSRSEVQSLRVYDSLATIWVMVRRTAFTELKYSWLRLVGTVIGLGLMFILPPALVVSGLALWIASMIGVVSSFASWGPLFVGLGLGTWGLMAAVYRPAVHFYELPSARLWTLPLAGVLYGAMTIDSAFRYATGLRIGWRDRYLDTVMNETPSQTAITRITQNDAPIAVFTALAWEGAAVRAVLKRVQREDEKVWRGFAGRKEVLVIISGIGPRRTQRTLEQFATVPFSAVFSVGCAGALVPGLATGQLILASDVCMYAAEGEQQLLRFSVAPQLFVHARAAALNAGVATAEGALFTSTKILFTPEEKEHQGKVTSAIAVEMESGVHAAFAANRELPFLVLRVILDGVGMRLPALKGLTTPDGEVRPVKAALYVATHPHHLPVLLALKQARTQASQTLSRLCHELFLRLA